MATMADIAERAGVALSTVSYVLSGKRSVSEETKRRVLRTIADLDYQPHAFARGLASKRTKTIALLFPALAKGHSEIWRANALQTSPKNADRVRRVV
jgi:DNA-binding LacI/PurR family transcriptional regulator